MPAMKHALALVLLLGCGHARPSPSDAQAGVSEFLQTMRLANNRTDPRMKLILTSAAARGGVLRPAPGSLVHRQGPLLVDGLGRPLKLRGANLGGTYLWEGWIWGGALSLTQTKRQAETYIRAGIASLLGDAGLRSFTQQIYDEFVTQDDLKEVAALGFNVVRVPINHRLLDDREAGFRVLDRLLGWAEQAGVYVILDLHAAPGGQSPAFHADPGPVSLWDSAENRQQTVALWQDMARRYAGRWIVAGYDLLNEPKLPKGRQAELVALYRDIIAAIRTVDPGHLLMLEGDDYARDFSPFTALLDDNQAYSFHMYTWFGVDRRIKELRQRAREQQVPLHCGEFGENNYGQVQKAVDLLDAPDSGTFGWTFWTWKRAPVPLIPALHEIPVSKRWKGVISWITAP